MGIAEPIIKKIKDNSKELQKFKQDTLSSKDEKLKDIIMNFPVVYIHNWKSGNNYEVYVGESNNIFQRTYQHYDKMTNEDSWQHRLSKSDANLYVIGHEHFNKSMTLDIENKLIHYLMSVESVKKVNNLRCNPQNHYFPVEELDNIFANIWKKLRKDNEDLFPLESMIKDSAIFKASPLHKLTEEQQNVKEKIIEKTREALQENKKGQLIFVEGEAGTGKTVLSSSIFYELICREEEVESEGKKQENLKCCLVVNHDEQITVYKQIVDKLGITDKYGEVIYKPTRFINNYSKDNLVDVVFIDEAHLLLTQGKQSYQGKNQLEDILERARVVVVMFDEDQILTTEQYWEDQQIEKYRKKAKESNRYIQLKNQLRMHASKEMLDWLNAFVKKGEIEDLPDNTGGYDIKFFDSPQELEREIKNKAARPETKLSRLIASYDWYYNEKKTSKEGICKYWEVKIGKWHKPWNRELEQEFNQKQKREIKGLSWAEQPHTIEEVGSTFTIHGFDLNYAGVIIGPSVKYRNGHVIFDPKKSANKKATRNRTLSDGSMSEFGEKLLQHELNVLMKRGVNGLYIYACDDELRNKLKECSKQKTKFPSYKKEVEYLKVAEENESYKYDK